MVVDDDRDLRTVAQIYGVNEEHLGKAVYS
jgi:hypothetical protein